MNAGAWARRLATGAPVDERVAVVVAHPDDETLWTGALIGRLRDGLLVMVTDGAPEDMGDARRLGLATREDYARLRAAEPEAALAALGGDVALLRLGIPDQDAAYRVTAIADRLAAALEGAAVVVTHPYEGGHPDHDAVALAARITADRLGVAVVEFACYAQFAGLREFARFVPHPDAPEHVRPFAPAEAVRIERALTAHASQASVFGTWRPEAERWRPAPRYDFSCPPPGEAVLYDGFGWAMTGEGWRTATRDAREAAWR